MRAVAGLITEVCLHCSSTSMLSGVCPRVASENPHSSMHPCFSQRLYNKLLGACPRPSLPTRQESGHVLKFVLSRQSCSPRVALGTVRSRTESHLAQHVSCGGMTRVYLYNPLLLCLRSPAQPSPAHFIVFAFAYS